MELLEKHFDTAFDAPNGIEELRGLILTLAIKGKLVEQDESDQSADDLLEEVEQRKQQLIREKRLKKTKSIADVRPEEIPYTLPASWSWVRLKSIGEINPRNVVDNDEIEAGFVPMPLIFSEYGKPHSFKKRPWSEIKKGYTHFANGDVGLAKITPCFENAKSCVFADLPSGVGAGTTELHIFRNTLGTIFPQYLLAYFKSSRYISTNKLKMTGSAGQKRVPTDLFADNPFPLPPLAEQRRIVAKIDQLMARCDELEKLREARDRTRIKVHMAACDRLLTAPDTDAFTQSWQFITQHFSELYSVKENVAELRKAILQLAIMGKLIPQDSKTKSVKDLLSRVEDNRQKLNLPRVANSISSSEPLGYRIPESWTWRRLESLLTFGPTNGFSPKAVDYETSIRSLTLTATTSGVFKGEHSKFIPGDTSIDSKLWLTDGDILVQRGNTYEYVGIPAIYRGEPNVYIYPDLMMRLRVSSELDTDFVCLAMSSKPCRDYLRARASGTSGTMPKINQKTLKSLPIPIPPLDEQKLIVAKVDQLMTLCDTLEQKIDATTQKQTALLNAVTSKI